MLIFTLNKLYKKDYNVIFLLNNTFFIIYLFYLFFFIVIILKFKKSNDKNFNFYKYYLNIVNNLCKISLQYKD